MNKNVTVKKKKQMSMLDKKALTGWAFVSPFVLGFLLLFFWIYIESFIFSFQQIDINKSGGFTTTFVGWQNYLFKLKVDPVFNRDLVNSVKDMLLNIPIVIMLSLFIAVVLNQKMKGRAIFRAVFFIPVILATGIIQKADLSNSILGAYASIPGIDVGSSLLESTTDVSGGLFTVGELKYYMEQLFSFSPVLTQITVGAAQNIQWVINNSGVQILIFLAGLQGIAPSLYESAQIEGCSAWESFWKITFPMISPLILTNIIYSMVDSFTGARNAIMNSITQAMSIGEYGQASAMAWLYFAVVAVIMGLLIITVSRFIFYQNKE